MDRLAALRLQIEWGADEALEREPVDRLRPGILHPASLAEPPPSAHLSSSPAPPSPVPPAPAPIALSNAGQAPAADARHGTPPAWVSAAAEAAETLDDLRIAVARFDSPLRDTASHTVFGEGPPDATIMLVGDAPGSDEDREGRPFVGTSEEYLGRMLASIGIDRAGLRLTTVLPWRPPGNRPPTEAEIAACLPFFRRHVALVGPRYLLLVGQPAARIILAGKSRRSGRAPAWAEATFAGLDPIPVLILPSLVAAMRRAAARREAWAALRLLRRTMNQQ